MTTATEVLTAFLVVVGLDGRIQVATDDAPPFEVQHIATIEDIEMYASQIARQAGRTLTAFQNTAPVAESTSEVVAKALKKRKQD